MNSDWLENKVQLTEQEVDVEFKWFMMYWNHIKDKNWYLKKLSGIKIALKSIITYSGSKTFSISHQLWALKLFLSIITVHCVINNKDTMKCLRKLLSCLQMKRRTCFHANRSSTENSNKFTLSRIPSKWTRQKCPSSTQINNTNFPWHYKSKHSTEVTWIASQA